MEIKKISGTGIKEALELVWKVFLQFEAPDYSEEGINTFREFIDNKWAISGLNFYGAYIEGNIIGVIATRNEGKHISLFFVHSKYHRKGIGRKLFEAILEESTADIITVNSSPYALEVYHKLGFVDVSEELMMKGIRYTPMRFEKI